VNDDLRLSLFLDGRLPVEEAAAFETRLAAEPALRARLDAMRRLQQLSAGLGHASAAFCGDDVRVRAEVAPHGGWRRLGLAAAAVLALAVTHAGVYLAGARRGAEAERAERASVEQAAALLERAAELDIAAPPDELVGEIDALRREIPTRLIALSEARLPEAVLMADKLRQVMNLAVEEQRDPAFVCLRIAMVARSTLDGGAQVTFIPASATDYDRAFDLGGGRFRVICVEIENGTPRAIVDEGTPEEIETRRGIRLRPSPPRERR
jgi:hypothetical protein